MTLFESKKVELKHKKVGIFAFWRCTGKNE